MTNSARWVTWKYAAVPPPGQARLDQDIVAQIFLRVRDLYKKEGGKFPDPILNLSWAYADAAHPSLSQVAMELNGRALADLKDPVTKQVIKAGQQLPGFAWLKDDGTTMCGNWIYSGMLDRSRVADARSAARKIRPAWASFRTGHGRGPRIGASCITARPATWRASRGTRIASRSGGTKRRGKWVGNDVPDFKPDSHPKDHMGPFIMNPEGVGRLFAPIGVLADGPFPEHYEPIESPIKNPLHPDQSNNPLVKKFKTPYRQIWIAGRIQHRLHHLPAHRAISLLDEK